jgi:hypothetical protein
MQECWGNLRRQAPIASTLRINGFVTGGGRRVSFARVHVFFLSTTKSENTARRTKSALLELGVNGKQGLTTKQLIQKVHMLKRFYGEILIGCSAVVAFIGAGVSGYTNWGVGLTMLLAATLSIFGLTATLRRRFKMAIQPNRTANNDLSESSDSYAADLSRRERELAERLLVFQEWMEFPAPSTVEQPERSDSEWSELSERDRQLFKLLEDESQRIFDRILTNEYSVDGRVQIDTIRDEALHLVQSVGRIYRPDLDEPLLETSSEKVLRAASRICLQMLVLIEQLPLDVKSYNLKRLHSYIQKAVKAYGMYRSVEPYWPYLNRAYYLGRAAMGASPISLGAWWVASTLGTKGAKELTGKFVNQQALRLLQDVVRVIGFEVASLYSEDFRYRDGNWIYASLLTNLLSTRELDSKTLTIVMTEIGTLPLRSEYDRVFLYRCVATQHAAPTGSVPLSRLLEPTERRAICRRLHAFAQKLPTVGRQIPDAWIEQVETWLDVRWPKQTLTGEEEIDHTIAGLRSLLGFLLEFKNMEPELAVNRIRATRLFRQLSPSAQDDLSRQMELEPPYFFEQPMLDIESRLAREFCDDLIELAVNCTPADPAEDDLFRQIAAYLHLDDEVVQQKLERETQSRLSRLYVHLHLNPMPPRAVANLIMELAPDSGAVTALFHGVHLQGKSGRLESNLWLATTSEHLWAIRAQPTVGVVWMSDGDTTLDVASAWSGNSATLTGGEWVDVDTPADVGIVVSAGLLQRSDTFFDPIRSVLRQ